MFVSARAHRRRALDVEPLSCDQGVGFAALEAPRNDRGSQAHKPDLRPTRSVFAGRAADSKMGYLQGHFADEVLKRGISSKTDWSRDDE